MNKTLSILNDWCLHCTLTPGWEVFRSMPALHEPLTRFPVLKPQVESRNPISYAFSLHLYSVHLSLLHYHPDHLSPELPPRPSNLPPWFYPSCLIIYIIISKSSQSLSSSLLKCHFNEDFHNHSKTEPRISLNFPHSMYQYYLLT